MVMDIVVYHPSVTQYLKFVSTTAGRDKLLRTLQYFARFYAWYLVRTNGTAAAVAPWEAIKKQFSLVRKVMRVGKNVEHAKAASVAADAKTMDPVLRYTTIGRQLGYFGYLTLDSATVLDATGIRRWQGAKALQRGAYRLWAMGLICSLMSQAYVLDRLRRRKAVLDRKDGEGAVESKRIDGDRATSRLQLLSDVCDLAIPASALGWVALDDGVVGLAGTVSSLIGLLALWRKTV